MSVHTEQEQKVMDRLLDVWTAFVELERQHPDELDEFRKGIHFLQYMIATRAVRRLDPQNWPTYSDSSE